MVLHSDGDFFRIIETATTTLRHFIPDVITTQKFPVTDLSQLSNPPDKIGRTEMLWLDGQEQTPTRDELGEQMYIFEIKGTEARTIKFLRQFWVQIGDPVGHKTRRFTKFMSVMVTNSTGGTVCLVQVDASKQEIAAGSKIKLKLLVDPHSIYPNTPVYGFTIEQRSSNPSIKSISKVGTSGTGRGIEKPEY